MPPNYFHRINTSVRFAALLILSGFLLQPTNATEPSALISGSIQTVTIQTDGKIRIVPKWNQPAVNSVWIGFSQYGALYGTYVIKADLSHSGAMEFALPDNLPEGQIQVECIPLGVPVSDSPKAYFTVPKAAAAEQPVALAWGVYHEGNAHLHPWNVNTNGLMYWDGEPYIPVGGMINSRLTWQTYADKETPGVIASGKKILRAQFELLRKYGIKDIYFNAFFLRSNPEGLKEAVRTAEEMGLRYGLHVSTVPENRSLGFQAVSEMIPVPAGADSAEIRYAISERDLRTSHRCVWMLVTEKGDPIEHGVGTMKVEEHKPDKTDKGKSATTKRDLVMKAEFATASSESRRLVYLPEIVMNAQDPAGYFDGIDAHINRIKTVYRDLPLGPGMRLWIDPFQNEMHAYGNQVCTAPSFRSAYAAWLKQRYPSAEALKTAWGSPAALSFDEAVKLVPLRKTGGSAFWLDPEKNELYRFVEATSEASQDFVEFRGYISQDFVNKASNALKEVANVPVILKHNTFFNDAFVNREKAGGQDGLGYEPYGCGDSLAYHNSLVAYAEALASARRQWTVVTETSPAAFNGQKPYIGYLDRLQMMDDFDLMTMYGAKGIYTFGLAFDPPLNFQITELIRDPRQLEWLATYAKTIRAAASQLAQYKPSVYGWYPASLREESLFGANPQPYAMDGHYLGRPNQIRMAPDGNWIVPAIRLDAGWKGILANLDALKSTSWSGLKKQAGQTPLYLLSTATHAQEQGVRPLNGFTANGVDLISPQPKAMTLGEFREKVLGYRVFQTAGFNGMTLPGGKLLVWICAEREAGDIQLPQSAKAESLQGTPIALQGRTLHLQKQVRQQLKEPIPEYLAHSPKAAYYYTDDHQPEAAALTGVTADQILALNEPAWHRWLPQDTAASAVTAWCEAETPEATTFSQRRVEGYSRYSEGAAIGINIHFSPPAGRKFFARYKIRTSGTSTTFWMRRANKPAMDLEVFVDGRSIGVLKADAEPRDLQHLSAWNAGLAVNKIQVGWLSLPLAQPLAAGNHTLEIVAAWNKGENGSADTALLGGQSDAETASNPSRDNLRSVQIDAYMLTK